MLPPFGAPIRRPALSEGLTKLVGAVVALAVGRAGAAPGPRETARLTAGLCVVLAAGAAAGAAAFPPVISALVRGFEVAWLKPLVFRMEGLSALGLKRKFAARLSAGGPDAIIMAARPV